MPPDQRPVETSTRGNVRCSAHSSRTGEPCRKWAVAGSNVCQTHGGSAPQVKAKARLRLLAASDPVAAALVKIALDKNQPAAARVQACKDILDRAGLKQPEVVEHRQTDLASAEDVRKWRDDLAVRRAKKEREAVGQ